MFLKNFFFQFLLVRSERKPLLTFPFKKSLRHEIKYKEVKEKNIDEEC